MVKTAPKPSPAAPGKAYVRVGECLWRNAASGIYYAFVKRRSKQFHHSLKTKDRDTLRHIFEFARRDGLILDNPGDHIPRRKLTKVTMVIPTTEQFRLLVRTIRESDERGKSGADLVELLASSGMRLREATSL